MDNNSITQKLKNHKYRLTNQREAVLEVMLDKQGSHLSADEVLQEARLKQPEIGIATVYRTLEKLASMDILNKSMFDDKYRYEISDHTRHRHHHLICLDCGDILEIEEDLLYNLEKHVEDQGFMIINHELKFYGFCSRCKQVRDKL